MEDSSHLIRRPDQATAQKRFLERVVVIETNTGCKLIINCTFDEKLDVEGHNPKPFVSGDSLRQPNGDPDLPLAALWYDSGGDNIGGTAESLPEKIDGELKILLERCDCMVIIGYGWHLQKCDDDTEFLVPIFTEWLGKLGLGKKVKEGFFTEINI